MNYGNFIIHHSQNTSSSDARHTINFELPNWSKAVQIWKCILRHIIINKTDFGQNLGTNRKLGTNFGWALVFDRIQTRFGAKAVLCVHIAQRNATSHIFGKEFEMEKDSQRVAFENDWWTFWAIPEARLLRENHLFSHSTTDNILNSGLHLFWHTKSNSLDS